MTAPEVETPTAIPVGEIPAKSGALVRVEDPTPEGSGSIAAFASLGNFRAAQSMAIALSSSTLVPAIYRGRANIGNCLIAMELAGRCGASVLMVMQNLFVVDGKPGWSSAFLIGAVNTSGRFTPLRFQFDGTPSTEGWRCRAVARDKQSGEQLEGEWITWAMVKAEGWLQKRGSKWQTMPGQMMRYRSAAFWSRVFCPEISLGMHTAEELTDIVDAPTESLRARELTEALRASAAAAEAESGEKAGAHEPAIVTGDEPCEACEAKPGEPHKSECPHA